MRAEARGGGAWEAILCPLTLVGVVLAAYRPLLDHDGGWGLAQEWDDRNNFLENDLVRRPLSRETLRGMWSARRINVFEPLGWLLKARARAAREEYVSLANCQFHRQTASFTGKLSVSPANFTGKNIYR